MAWTHHFMSAFPKLRHASFDALLINAITMISCVARPRPLRVIGLFLAMTVLPFSRWYAWLLTSVFVLRLPSPEAGYYYYIVLDWSYCVACCVNDH